MTKVLVTGASGFVGKKLCSELINSGYQVFTLKSNDGDISEPSVFRHIPVEDIKHVFHLAARSFVPESWEKSLEYYRVNVIGTQNVLEYCRKTGAALTFVSSFVYGTDLKLPVSESHKIEPANPYAHSKYLAEQLCEFYHKNFDVRLSIIRPFNIYGSGQKQSFLVPHIIQQVKNASEVRVKTLIPKRDMVFLDDLVNALILTIPLKDSFTIFNIGSGYSLSVREIIEIIQRVMGTNKPIKSEKEIRKNEIADVVADIQYANVKMKWKPNYSFEEGITKILAEQ